jgi:hypothetical protein
MLFVDIEDKGGLGFLLHLRSMTPIIVLKSKQVYDFSLLFHLICPTLARLLDYPLIVLAERFGLLLLSFSLLFELFEFLFLEAQLDFKQFLQTPRFVDSVHAFQGLLLELRVESIHRFRI